MSFTESTNLKPLWHQQHSIGQNNRFWYILFLAPSSVFPDDYDLTVWWILSKIVQRKWINTYLYKWCHQQPEWTRLSRSTWRCHQRWYKFLYIQPDLHRYKWLTRDYIRQDLKTEFQLLIGSAHFLKYFLLFSENKYTRQCFSRDKCELNLS